VKAGRHSHSGRAFTLVELLMATVVLMIVMVVLLRAVSGVAEVWKMSTGKISAFQNARSAFATMNRTLARATLNTYNDYVNAAGAYRTQANANTFTPVQFARASELHFLSGPAAGIVPGGGTMENPGSAIFFQAPLGDTNDSGLESLNRSLNACGFYIQWGDVDDSLFPAWLQSLFATKKRFRLLQIVEPTEDLEVYNALAGGSYPAPVSGTSWLEAFKTPRDANQPRTRVLAEDVPLLVFRPRLAPKDEEAAAAKVGSAYSAASLGSILSPAYHYDSRAWQSGYPSGRVTGEAWVELMRNQIPPIVDVAMVSVDRRSLARFDESADDESANEPPAELQVPVGLFTESSKFEDDLATYSKQLSDAGIRHRVFRTSVEIQSAKWSQ